MPSRICFMFTRKKHCSGWSVPFDKHYLERRERKSKVNWVHYYLDNNILSSNTGQSHPSLFSVLSASFYYLLQYFQKPLPYIIPTSLLTWIIDWIKTDCGQLLSGKLHLKQVSSDGLPSLTLTVWPLGQRFHFTTSQSSNISSQFFLPAFCILRHRFSPLR